MMRLWEGQIRNGKGAVEVGLRFSQDHPELIVAREMVVQTELDWCGANTTEIRPSDSNHYIWVARFFDRSELLIEWWHEPEVMKVAWRDMSFHSWGAPTILTEVNTTGGQQ